MYRYGITFKNGQSGIYESNKNETELIAYLNSAKWVALNILDEGQWVSGGGNIIAKFTATLVNIDNISTIDFLEE